MRRIRGFLLAVFALAALAAAPAAASAADGLSVVPGTPAIPAGNPTVEAGKYPSSITGERYENGSYKGKLMLLDAGDWGVNCETAEIDGGVLSAPAETLALNAAYTKCHLGGEVFSEATVSMKSCHYSYPGFEELAEDSYATEAEIICSGGDAIKVSSTGCTVTIPAQSLAGETELSNETLGGKAVVLAGMVGSDLQYTASGKLCGFIGVPTGTYEDGVSESHMTLRGFFLAPGTPAIPATDPTLEAEEYPANIAGERFEYGSIKGDIVLLDTGEHAISCEVAELDGGVLSGPAEALTLEATYSECTSSASNVFISMNSCRYSYPSLEELYADAFATEAEIACSSEGDAIKVSSTGCTVTIPAQSLAGEAALYNETIGGDEVVLAGMIGSGLQYTAKGIFCSMHLGVSAGTYENGASESHMTLRGVAS